jgi:CRP-like cAMP-binding protein
MARTDQSDRTDLVDFPTTGNFLRGRLRQHFDRDDQSYIEELIQEERVFSDGQVVMERAQFATISAILVDGFIFRTIEQNDRRFIVGLNVPGDFVDLHAFALKRLDHNVVTAGNCKLGLVSHDRLDETMRERPKIARAMWFATLLDAAVHRKWIQILEQLDAPQCVAHIFCELQTRLEHVGRASQKALRTPFKQFDIADMTGISTVHANRAIVALKEMRLAEWRRGTLYVNDWQKLKEYARFEADYLYGEGALKLSEPFE